MAVIMLSGISAVLMLLARVSASIKNIAPKTALIGTSSPTQPTMPPTQILALVTSVAISTTIIPSTRPCPKNMACSPESAKY